MRQGLKKIARLWQWQLATACSICLSTLVVLLPNNQDQSLADTNKIQTFSTNQLEISAREQQIDQNIINHNLYKNSRQVTVRVHVAPGGSGFIIQKTTDSQTNTYIVLTNAHVVRDGEKFKIETSDGKLHPAILYKKINFKDNDLALLQFQTTLTYPIAKLAPSKTLKTSNEVYAAGFPYDIATGNSEQFRFIFGRVSIISSQRLLKGYQFGYTSNVKKGMSGGPVFNQRGEVVAVNGIQAYPLTNKIYTFPNGKKPEKPILALMRQSAFAIPIETFMNLAAKPLNLEYAKPEATASNPLDRTWEQRETPFDALNLIDKVSKVLRSRSLELRQREPNI